MSTLTNLPLGRRKDVVTSGNELFLKQGSKLSCIAQKRIMPARCVVYLVFASLLQVSHKKLQVFFGVSWCLLS